MTRSWTIWLWLLDPNEQSFFLFWVNFCLTNVCVSVPLIPGFEAVVTWEKGRYTTLHNSLKLCSAYSLYTRMCQLLGRGQFTSMKHKLLFLFSYGQNWLQRVILLYSFHKVLHSRMALDGTCTHKHEKHSQMGLFQPPVSVAMQFLHQYIDERICAPQLGVRIPSLIMTHCVALYKTFNLICKMGQLLPRRAMGRNKRHTYGKMLCKLKRAVEM